MGWNNTINVSFHEKGDKSEQKNYKPITVLFQAYTLFNNKLNHKIVTNPWDSGEITAHETTNGKTNIIQS